MEQPRDHVRFSVIVPAYNEAAYLGRALHALQHQDYDGKYEIIVVDNNSTDATVAVAARYGVRVVSEPRQGVCAARQRGVDCAQGEIIVSTDADTTQPRDWLGTIEARFAGSDKVVAVAGPCRYQNPSWWAEAYPTLLFGLVASILDLYTSQCFTLGIVEGVRQPIAVNAKLRNVPDEAIFNWEPQGQIGVYRPDGFFYGG